MRNSVAWGHQAAGAGEGGGGRRGLLVRRAVKAWPCQQSPWHCGGRGSPNVLQLFERTVTGTGRAWQQQSMPAQQYPLCFQYKPTDTCCGVAAALFQVKPRPKAPSTSKRWCPWCPLSFVNSCTAGSGTRVLTKQHSTRVTPWGLAAVLKPYILQQWHPCGRPIIGSTAFPHTIYHVWWHRICAVSRHCQL